MPTYNVTAKFDITVPSDEALQRFAFEYIKMRFPDGDVESTFLDNTDQAADWASQSVQRGLMLLLTELLGRGALQVSGDEPGAVTIGTARITSDAPDAPA